MTQLIFGDCLALLPTLGDKSIDLVLADMPYGTTRCAWDSQIDLDRLWPELRRVARGAIVLFAQTPFDKVLGASNLPMLRYEWIWEKTAATGFLNAKRAPLKAHENVLVFYERQPTYIPQKTAGHEIKRTKASYADHGPNYGKAVSVRAPYCSTERFPRSVQKFAKDNRMGKLHPTQKPVELCRFLIRTYSQPGETVLDFCMGSGTTGVAAAAERRRFIGIESDPTHFETAEQRLSERLAA